MITQFVNIVKQPEGEGKKLNSNPFIRSRN